MENSSSTGKRKLIVPAIGLVVAGFIGGQAAPVVIPADWKAGTQELDFNSLSATYDILQKKYDGDLNHQKVMDGARTGLVSGAEDPYTVYLNPEQAKELDDQLSGTLSGVGAEIGIKNNRLTVIAPVAGAPAERAGIQAGDYIARINEEDTSGLTTDEAVAKIRGEAGTEVKLTVVRGSQEPLEIKITREVINVPSVKWSMKNGNVAYIQVTQFGSDTSEKVEQAAAELKAQGAQKVILDLRNDPGGYLPTSVDVASQFLPAGKTVVEERKRGKTTDKLTSSQGGLLIGMPTVVLINEGSASASEIVAGALKDNGAAKLIGEKSFGKGSVQEVVKLGGGAQLKVTVARWYTPSGKGIDKEGIKPDIEVKQDRADFNADRDPQLDRALAELK